jgi:hypothetical protein
MAFLVKEVKKVFWVDTTKRLTCPEGLIIMNKTYGPPSSEVLETPKKKKKKNLVENDREIYQKAVVGCVTTCTKRKS